MKEYSFRIEVKIEANSDEDAKRKIANYIRELPRQEGFIVRSNSLYSYKDKKEIK
jgi:Uma2 family endonuclease